MADTSVEALLQQLESKGKKVKLIDSGDEDDGDDEDEIISENVAGDTGGQARSNK